MFSVAYEDLTQVNDSVGEFLYQVYLEQVFLVAFCVEFGMRVGRVSNTRSTKQEFKEEISPQEKYDREKAELLQDNFDLHQQSQVCSAHCSEILALAYPFLVSSTNNTSYSFM
jgi:hypothetical protein